MEKLVSKKFKLPEIFFISDRKEIESVPHGIPYFFGNEKIKKYVIRHLEYEILLKKAKESGFPFNFKKILRENGFNDLKSFSFTFGDKLDESDAEWEDHCLNFDISGNKYNADDQLYKEFIADASAVVNVQKLKDLGVFPIWLNKIEEAIYTNIQNYAAFNPNMYSKKLDGVYGDIELRSPNKNLIIIDISGSIPKAVSTTCLTLAKNLAESFYADLLITGSKSTLYDYSEIDRLDVSSLYDINGMGNDKVYFKNLVSGSDKEYATAIVFGDNHSPGYSWSNDYNHDTETISVKNGKKLNKWKIDKLISFHTDNGTDLAGYSTWFEPKEVEKIEEWVTYLD